MKSIPGYEGSYSVTKDGKVWSHPKQKRNRMGLYKTKGMWLKPYKNKSGYYSVALDGNKINVHRIVALTYIPNLEQKPQVNHKDMDRSNNNINNLEWVTNKENHIHSWKQCSKEHLEKKLKHVRRIAKMGKLNEQDVIYIKRKWEEHGRGVQPKLAKEFGVHLTTINRAINNKTFY